MSDLYRINPNLEHVHSLGKSKIYQPASRSDVLEWLGWSECERCGGTGWMAAHSDWPLTDNEGKPCPNNCLSGLVPPASQVEALLRAIDDWPAVDTPEFKGLDGRAALIASMKGVGDE